jgi:phosphatidylglycerophosphatase A
VNSGTEADLRASRPLTAAAVETLLGSVFGTGFIPVAPATFASLVSLGLVWLLPKSLPLYAAATGAILLLAVWLAARLERRWGPDARRITIDETVGMLVSFLFVPFTWPTALTGFVLFRVFDIVKLPLLRRLELIPRGWGVVLDDVAAGVLTNIVLQVLFRIVWPVPAVS